MKPRNRYTLSIVGDVCDKNSLADFFADADSRTCVIHCAGIVSVASRPSPKLYQINVGGTWRILRQCLAHEVGRLIHVSSVHAIPEKPEGCVITESCDFSPGLVDGDYAKSKAAAAELVFDAAERGLNASIVFPYGIIGPGDIQGGRFTSMAKSFLAGKLPLTVRGGYDFVDVRDVAKGILTCSESGEPGKGCILSGHYITIRKMLQFVGKAAKLKYRPICLPLSLAKLAAPYYERRSLKKRKPLFFTPYFVAVLASNGQFSHAAASECFAYHPRPMEKTLWDTGTCRIGQRRKGENVLGTIEGFYVREVDAPDAGWTYSDEVYYARFSIDASEGNNVQTLTLYPAHKTDTGYVWDRGNPVERMSFTNSYTENLRTVEVPFTKTVKLGGNASPGRTMEIFDIGNGNTGEYKDVTYTAAVTTRGVGSYDGKLIISGPEY